jgi:tripartite ATP-independent transporter DctM subunit
MTLLLMIVIFFALLLLGAPILVAMGVAGAAWLLSFGGIPVMSIAQKIYTATDSFALMAVPFFMLGGQVMEKTGITQKLVDFADACIGWVRGGLACCVELAGMLMAGISGSSNADASALGSILVRSLKKGGYEDGWAVAITSSAASIGPIIPPSCVMIVYANAAGLNIGKLFMGGIIPGILLGIGYMIVCVIYARRHGIAKIPFRGWKHLGKTFLSAIWALLMPLIIIGGILSGIFTATESGCIAALYGIAYGLISRKLKPSEIPGCFKNAIVSSIAPLSLIAFSSIISFCLAREGVTAAIASFCLTYLHSQFLLLLFVIVICVIAGMFIDNTATMLILTPILLPIVQQMGINVLQFSMIFMIAIMSGGLTPPVGGLLFITASVDNIPLSKCVKPIIPFVGIVVAVMIIMCFIPQISTLIPGLLG